MKFDGTEILFAFMQYAGWGGCGFSLLAAVFKVGGDRFGESQTAAWLTLAIVLFSAAIAATLGRVHIHTLNELSEIRKLMQSRNDNRHQGRKD